MHFHGGSVIPHTQNGWVSPPPEVGHPPVPKIVGRTEGEDNVADEVESCDNLWWSTIVVGLGNLVPSSIGRVWEGSTSLGGLGAQDSCVYQCDNQVRCISLLVGAGHRQ
jgi:hypothetical protein